MTTRDSYIALLEKRAASNGDALSHSAPPTDSVEASTKDHNANKADHNAYLHSIFSQAGAVQSNQSTELKKLFPNMPNGTIVSNPLIKVGRDTFFAALNHHGNSMKIASPIHIEIAFNAFCDELDKIAMVAPLGGGGSLSRSIPKPMGMAPALQGGAMGNSAPQPMMPH